MIKYLAWLHPHHSQLQTWNYRVEARVSSKMKVTKPHHESLSAFDDFSCSVLPGWVVGRASIINIRFFIVGISVAELEILPILATVDREIPSYTAGRDLNASHEVQTSVSSSCPLFMWINCGPQQWAEADTRRSVHTKYCEAVFQWMPPVGKAGAPSKIWTRTYSFMGLVVLY